MGLCSLLVLAHLGASGDIDAKALAGEMAEYAKAVPRMNGSIDLKMHYDGRHSSHTRYKIKGNGPCQLVVVEDVIADSATVYARNGKYSFVAKRAPERKEWAYSSLLKRESPEGGGTESIDS